MHSKHYLQAGLKCYENLLNKAVANPGDDKDADFYRSQALSWCDRTEVTGSYSASRNQEASVLIEQHGHMTRRFSTSGISTVFHLFCQ